MQYKLIVYKKQFIKVETKRGLKSVVYFQKVATYHNIHKSNLTKEYLKTWEKYQDTCYHITQLQEQEQDTIIDAYNQKARKYAVAVGV